MGKKKKQFIDKKTAATFTIVQRKQGDSYDGEVVTGSKYMLQPARYDTPLPADFPLDLLQVPGHATEFRKVVAKREGKGEENDSEEEEDEGEYNYEQHMRSIGDTGISEASSVFVPNPSAPALDIRQKAVASEGKEEDEGERLFSKAVKPERMGRLKLSKDLAKALEGEEGYDEIDDDFVLTAIRDQSELKEGDAEDFDEGDLFEEEGDAVSDAEDEGEEDEGEEEDEGDNEEQEEFAVPLSAKGFSKKVELITKKSEPTMKKLEPATKKTDPVAHKALTSILGKGTSKGILNSVFAKHLAPDNFSDEGDEGDGDEEEGDDEEENENEVNGRPKRPIDAQFDSLLDQYDDDEDIGELDPDNPELQGGVENLDDYAKEISEFTSRQEREYGGEQAVPISESEKLKVIEKLEMQAAEGEESIATTHAKIEAMFAVTEKENWDCESIVSTYSNTENHPLMIKRPSKTSTKPIKLSSKTGIPIGYFPTREKPEAVQEEEEEEEGEGDEVVRGNLGVARNKSETKAEKQARKKEVKEARREARGRKKDLKLQYTAELSRQLNFEHHQQLHNPPVTKM